MTEVTGPLLRLLREHAGLGLRAVARGTRNRMSLSDSHLSRVERGQRPVTPAILSAYERALRTRIDADAIATLLPGGAVDQTQRQAFNTTLASITLGAPAGDYHRLLAAAETPALPPRHVGASDVDHVTRAAALVRDLDLHHGGQLSLQVATRLLNWALPLRTATMTDQVHTGLHAAIGTLATFAAWAAFDTGHHQAAGHFHTLALDAAVTADDPDLRAHILADVAAIHNHHGHPHDALRILRLADGDERTTPALRAILHGVRANTHASLGQGEHTTRHTDQARYAAGAVTTGTVPAWLGGWHPAHTAAVCAHATATLATATGDDTTVDDTHLADADQQLSRAAAALAATGRTRALALCQARLALLHLHHGDPDRAHHWTEQAHTHAIDLRSARVTQHLAAIHTSTHTPPPGPDGSCR
jgi:transcriptional regulator with XRE-family HTH domain